MNVLERKKLKFQSFTVSEFFVRCRRTHLLKKYLRIHANSFHIIFYQNQFINECIMKNILKFQERQMTFCDLQ